MTPWWGSLLFVIVGAFLSASTAYVLQRARTRQERRDKRNDERREALASALAWIEPLDQALMGAELEIYQLLSGEHSPDEFHAKYDGYLLPSISHLELSADMRLVLDTDPYPLLSGIRLKIARLRFDSFEVWHDTRRARGESRPLSIEEAREKCTIRVQELRAAGRRAAAPFV